MWRMPGPAGVRRSGMTPGGIGSPGCAVILRSRMTETRAFYRDVMRFPVELERENSFASDLRCLRYVRAGPGAPATMGRRRRARLSPFSRGRRICRTGVTGRCFSAIRTATSSRSTPSIEQAGGGLTARVRRPCGRRPCRATRPRPCRIPAGSSGRAGRRHEASAPARGPRLPECRWPRRSRGS